MNESPIFNKIKEDEIKRLLSCLQAQKLTYKKNAIVLSNVPNTNIFGIITKGKAEIIRTDYYGNRTILETLEENSIFESNIFSIGNNELSIIASTDIEIILFDYNRVITRCKKNCPYHNQLIDNLLNLIIKKLNRNYERIQILTKKTIREKLLEYFRIISEKQGSKKIKLPLTYTDLSDYLAIDRSALMREIKNLIDDGIITKDGKKINIIIY